MEGGVAAYTSELNKALTTLGHEISVVTSTPAAGSAGENVYPLIARWDWTIWRNILALARKIDADWMHVQYQTAAFAMNPAINFAPQFWKRSHSSLAWTYHDLLVPYLFPKAGPHIRRWVTERPAHTSDLVIVTNEGDQLQLAQQGVKAAKIAIGSNITSTLHTSDQRQLRRRKRRFAHDDLVVGYFGFLNRSKGAATAVRTLARLLKQRRNAHLFMIGNVAGASDPTNQAHFREIEQMIIDLGLIDRVRWTGRQEDGEVSADLGACDVLLMPYEDGASLRRGTLMAGLANGCPIITTTPQTPLPELVDGRDLLYIAPGDDEAATTAILRLATDKPLAMTLRTNAFERSKLFTWQSIAEQHVANYTQLWHR